MKYLQLYDNIYTCYIFLSIWEAERRAHKFTNKTLKIFLNEKNKDLIYFR
jgi:hypothetical protein